MTGGIHARVPVAVLEAAVKTAARPVWKGAPTHLPVLNGVRIEFLDGQASVTGSDLDMTVTTVIDAEVSRPGAVIVPAKYLANILAKLPPDETLSARHDPEAREVELVAGRAALELRTLNPVEWPRLEAPGGTPVHMDEDTWDALARTARSASSDAGRPALTGVNFFDGWAQATDSYRMSVCPLPDGTLNGLVPARAIQDAARLGDMADILIGDNLAMLTVDRTTITTRLIDANPPDLMKILRRSHDVTTGRVTVDSAALSDAVALLGAVTGPYTPIRLQVNDDEHLIVSGSADNDHGTTALPMTGDGLTSPALVAFYQQRLSEAIADTCPNGGPITLRVDDIVQPDGFIIENVLIEGLGLDHMIIPTRP